MSSCARSCTCCAWSAGLTSTTVLPLRALRVKVDVGVQVLWFRIHVVHLVACLSTNTTVFREFCCGLRVYIPPKLSHFDSLSRALQLRSSPAAAPSCVWPCASWSVGTARRRRVCIDRLSMSGGASHTCDRRIKCSRLTVRSRFPS